MGASKTASCLRNAAALKLADESWGELWVRADSELDELTETLMAEDETLALLTATHFGKGGDR